jgi:hypothetical protein
VGVAHGRRVDGAQRHLPPPQRRLRTQVNSFLQFFNRSQSYYRELQCCKNLHWNCSRFGSST